MTPIYLRDEHEATGGRRRVRYPLTDAGRALLGDRLLQPDAGYELRDEGLLKVFLADALEPEEALERVREMRRHRRAVADAEAAS